MRSRRLTSGLAQSKLAWILKRRMVMFSLAQSSRKRTSERLTADEEKDIAREIRLAEQVAQDAIAEIAVAKEILNKKPERVDTQLRMALTEATQNISNSTPNTIYQILPADWVSQFKMRLNFGELKICSQNLDPNCAIRT